MKIQWMLLLKEWASYKYVLVVRVIAQQPYYIAFLM
jgi:hypothetical protein